MDVRSSTPEGAHFDEIHTSANFDANSNKCETHAWYLKNKEERGLMTWEAVSSAYVHPESLGRSSTAVNKITKPIRNRIL